MKNNITKYFKEENVVFLEKSGKNEVLGEIIAFASRKSKINEKTLHELVFAREKLASTGLEYGLAIPHIKVDKLSEPLLFIGVCRNEITDYQCLDDESVKLIFFIVVGEDDHQSYLSLLQDISRMIRDRTFVMHLSQVVTSPGKICEMLKFEANKNLPPVR